MGKWSTKRDQRQAGSAPSPRERIIAARGASRWRGSVDQPRKSGGGGGVWLLRWLMTFAVLAGIVWIVWWLVDPRARTPILVLSVQDFDSDLIPPRPGATQEPAIWDRLPPNLLALSNPASFGSWSELKIKHQLDEGHPSAKNAKPDQPLLLISIAAQGVVDSSGEPCLLDKESPPFDEAKWIKLLDDVVIPLSRKYSGRYQRAVLFLDSGSQLVDWTMGILGDDFAARLAKMTENDQFPRDWLTIVHARGSADLTRLADSRGRILFADLLCRGLGGEAETSGDKEISFDELLGYLNGHSSVSPQILPNKDERSAQRLCYVRRSKTANPVATLQPSSAGLEKLRDLWTDHQAHLTDDSRLRQQPGRWAQYEWKLLQAERAWLAGCDHWFNMLKDEAGKLSASVAPSKSVSEAKPADRVSADWQRFFLELDKPETQLEREKIPAVADPAVVDPASALAAILSRDVLTAQPAPQVLKQLLLLRRRAEQRVRLESDFRAEAFLRTNIEQTEVRRRALEDLAIRRDWEKLQSDFGEIQQEYESHQKQTADVTRMLAQRDEFLEKMPWLLRWSDVAGEGQMDLVRLWNQGLPAFKQLEDTAKPSGSKQPPGSDSWNDVFTKLKSPAYDIQERAALVGPLTAANIRGAMACLSTPLVSGETRFKLLQQFAGKEAKPQSVDAATLPKSDQSLPLSFADCARHPLASLLTETNQILSLQENAPEADWGQWRSDGAEIRAVYASLQKSDSSTQRPGLALKPTIDGQLESDLSEADNLKKLYDNLVQVDRSGRAAVVCAMAGGTNDSTFDTLVERLAKVQRACYLNWRAQRAVLDFYGPLGQDADWKKSYFLAEAQRWCDLLDRNDVLAGRLQRQLLAWTNADGPWLDLTANPMKLDYGSNSKVETIKLALQPGTPPEEAADRPAGNAAVAGPGKSASSPDTGLRQQASLNPPWSEPFPINRIQAGAFEAKLPSWRAYFRGHRSQEVAVIASGRNLPVTLTRQLTVEKPVPPQPATVYVKGLGDDKQRIWLVVVLDCSASMSTVDMKEAGKNVSRMSLAKKVLRGMASDLMAISQDHGVEFHVGLMAYGYRRGTYTGKNGKPEYPRWADLTPAGPNPEDDANNWLTEPPPDDPVTYEDDRSNLRDLELALDVGRLVRLDANRPLNQETLFELQEKIRQRIPIGETPLYLSILRALDEMKQVAAPGDERMIVVLTDGANRQDSLDWDKDFRKAVGLNIEPRNPQKFPNVMKIPPNAEQTRLPDLKKAMANSPQVTFKIIGLGKELADKVDQGEVKLLREFFQQPNTNRAFDVVESSSDTLVELLRFPIRTKKWQLLDLGANDVIDEKPLGGESVSVPSRLQKVAVRVVRKSARDNTTIGDPLAEADLKVKGGEKFELLFDEPRREGRLRYHRYWDVLKGENGEEGLDHEASDAATPTDDSPDWEAAAIAPEGDGSEQGFRIAFRPKDATMFPARPVLVRALLRPKSSGELVDDALPYCFEFNQAEFESGTEVPVLDFMVTGWHKDWDAAQLRLWVRLQESPSSAPQEAPLPLHKQRLSSDQQEFEIKGAKPRRIRVQSEPGAAGMTEVTVEQSEVSKSDVESGKALIVRLDPQPKPVQLTCKFVEEEEKLSTTFTIPESIRNETYLVIEDPAEVSQSANLFEWESIPKGN